jgi:glutathione S-transferase
VIRLWRFPHSTNAERVAIALAHKGLPVESVAVDPADRSEVIRVSGQPLVPVIQDGDRIVFDSPVILRYLEERHPEPPLWPREPARRAEVDVFVEWFNKVWKRPPNDIEAELGKPAPDRAQIDAWGRWMTGALDLFEALLTGRDYLMGDRLTAADVIAWPFLKYALGGRDRMAREGDTELFHEILVRWMPLTDGHRRLADWIRRLESLPKA